MNIPSEVF